ncbi:hypothetical protein GTGU_04282 [Trabulsiella guamensis ATCC 49490]|uniref:Uncharacterized protein n=1 Tax=Trabulsiella guamensis ATCC 49490 TaxID=1005994 RepID=A0A084ZP86_9ENTR|nr:hypothetical protein [Trabulsiella guamensis]KFB99280.1 hypothetical protein GTGU_04282 [Trabulsiella guamensis ATCC 49490]
MNTLGIAKHKVTLEVTETELLVLNSALNEVCNGIDIPEFETRLGATLTEVTVLLDEIGEVLDKMDALA